MRSSYDVASVSELRGAALRLRTTLLLFLAGIVLAACGGGSGSGDSTIPPSGLTYPTVPTFTVGHAIQPLTPTVTGFAPAFSISPGLPAGLSLNPSTGTLSGTPSAPSASRTYTVTASNDAGSTSTAITIAVSDAAPSISYGSTVTLTSGANTKIQAANTGGAATTWLIQPSLPAGLTFSTVDGSISGTPAAAKAPATYMVTASNAIGSSTTTFMLGVQSVLLDLGHSHAVVSMRMTASRLLSQESPSTSPGYWVLWNYAADTLIARGLASCWTSSCNDNTVSLTDMAGATLVAETSKGLEIRSATDGSLTALITTPMTWWKLAVDGSYLCAGTSSGLTAWTPTGAVITSRSGDYSNAVVFAAAGQMQVADGPAGTTVVETVTLPSGSSAVSPVFLGDFSAWFSDGQRFLTNAGALVYVYSSAGQKQDSTTLPVGGGQLAGYGDYFWSFSIGQTDPLNLYKVGASASPIATYPTLARTAVSSGATVALLTATTNQILVVDLSGAVPVSATTILPIPAAAETYEAYAATSGSQWAIGNLFGVLLDGASLSGTPRYLDLGQASSIAGSSSMVAIATASGSILYFDAATHAQLGTIPFASAQLALSTDGTVLAARGAGADLSISSEFSINIYSLPSGSETFTWPYNSTSGGPLPRDITLSTSGTLLGQVLGTYTIEWNCTRQLTATTGGPVIFSDALITGYDDCNTVPIRLSPDETKFAVSDQISNASTTKIYNNAALVTTVPGWVVGWIDDQRIWVNLYDADPVGATYHDAVIYDSAGNLLNTLSVKELKSIQIVGPNLIYDAFTNAIYSTDSGMTTWFTSTASTGLGAVAGADVVFSPDHQVVFEPF